MDPLMNHALGCAGKGYDNMLYKQAVGPACINLVPSELLYKMILFGRVNWYKFESSDLTDPRRTIFSMVKNKTSFQNLTQ